jgi:hypothetical protein
MPTIYRAVHRDQDVTDVGSIKAVDGVVRTGKVGRYRVDQIASKPLPSGHTSRRWGQKIKHRDASIADGPDPWPE